MSAPVEIRDWTDATRPMRGAVHHALQRLRDTLAPAPRITQPAMMSPYLLERNALDDELPARLERALDG